MHAFTLVNNDEEIKKYNLLKVIDVNDNGKKLIYIYESHNYIVFYKVMIMKTKNLENQTEIPKNALGWIVDTIRDGFWKKPTEGGLPRNQHAARLKFDGEDLILTRTMNATYGEPGFAIKNKSRHSYISKTSSQQVAITDKHMKSGVLDLFNQYRTDR